MMKNYIVKGLITVGCCMALIFSLTIVCSGNEYRDQKKGEGSSMKILLLGASVGNAWNFEDLSIRLKSNAFTSEFIAKYEADKTDILRQALNRKINKPDVIIIKQCAAYFRSNSSEYDPLPVKRYKQLMKEWVDKCLSEGVVPILATVVPITEEMPLKVKIKRLIKEYILFKNVSPYYRDVRLKGILEYNEWVKRYSNEKQLIVLDLEKAVRISEKNRYLNPDLSTDGLHLNEKAYQLLDVAAFNTLQQVFQANKVEKNNEH